MRQSVKIGLVAMGGFALGCADAPSGPGEPVVAFAKGGNGGGGNGGGGNGGGGNGGDSSPGLSITTITSAGAANALSGDGRDFDGAVGLPAGEGSYQADRCEVGFNVSSSSQTDTTSANLFTDLGGRKRRDPCAEANLVRVIQLDFPANPALGVEDVQNITFRWQTDQADEIGEVAWARGKITMFDAPSCAPIRFNPLNPDYAASSLIRVERIDGGWRLWTDAGPNNVGQCQDRTGGDPGVPGALFGLDFEFTIDEDVGDGAGPGG